MPLSTEVIVDASRDVVFPPRCVVCEQVTEGELETIALRGNPVGFYGVFPWLFRRTAKLIVPAHRPCGRRLAAAIMWRNLSMLIVTSLAVMIGIGLGWSKWPTIGLAAVAAILPVIWQVIRPLSFEFTHHGDYYKLEFHERPLAQEVADLNEGEIEEDIEDE